MKYLDAILRYFNENDYTHREDVAIIISEIFEETPDIDGLDNHVTYLINASAGQTMDVKIISPDIDVLSLGVYGQDDGQPYERYQVKNSGFHGVLPVTQGYYLEVFSFKKSTDFTLEITIL